MGRKGFPQQGRISVTSLINQKPAAWDGMLPLMLPNLPPTHVTLATGQPVRARPVKSSRCPPILVTSPPLLMQAVLQVLAVSPLHQITWGLLS